MEKRKEILNKLKPMELPPLPENPLVSVLIANYNYGQYIGEAIESVLNQTYQNFEIVICDDGSTDNSLEVIKRYAERDSRIKYIAKENGGVASALNAAFAHSTGEIICLLDADDIFLPKKLELVIKKFSSSSRPGHVYHRMRVIYSDGELGEINQPFMSLQRGYLGPDLYKHGGRWRFIEGSANCFRREVADLMFPIDETLFRTEADGYLCILAPILTIVECMPDVLALRRVHGKNVTGLISDVTPQSIRKLLSRTERILKGVNSRLSRLDKPMLDTSRNILFLERKTLLSFLASDYSFKEQLGLLWAFSGHLIEDDCYTFLQKAYRMLVYWTTILLPSSIRPAYLKLCMRFPKRIMSRLAAVIYKTAR